MSEEPLAPPPTPAPPVPVVIAGPTSSGKGLLAFELARRIGGEIASMDSMKVYREMDIGTAKPPPERRALVRYHLVDFVDPSLEFSVAEYLQLLDRAIEEAGARGRPVVIAGGTALYLKGYLDGFQAVAPADWGVRLRLVDEARAWGSDALHARLRGLDPQAAERIHPRDLRRIVRALEVVETTGRPLSGEWAWRAGPRRPRARVFGLDWDREALYARIGRRVELMVERGLFEEAQRLASREPPVSRTAAQSIGYKEIWEGLARGAHRGEIVARIQQQTRRFAKSQLTWLRKMPVEWIPVTEATPAERLVEDVLRRLAEPPAAG
ncbi:MAG: tRNA (adenosine(37)-N6)-dimethylallyltransferase MiaA [Planctomycetes bacterium]|nr:tRNA (adenosine(37)-N6)-dimethylallyltransferase MiaA [Planctomycetota bacterium]